MLRSPNLRGDDVHELQGRLARLGFDCGRVDGIFGPDTSRALLELQMNSGLEPDGVCGAETVAAIVRLCRQTGEGPGVAAVREIERLRDASRSLAGAKVVVGQFGGFSVLARQLIKGLRRSGAHVVAADEPDAGAQAATANRFGAAVYLGLEAHADPMTSIAYYGVPGFESSGGRHLASLIEREFVTAPLEGPVQVMGMRLPVLRETRMPAVVCSLGTVRTVVDHAPEIADHLVSALVDWIRHPIEL
jgi:N-acetylmuramoyl-L-alanine amidase